MAYVGCIAGALTEGEFHAALSAAGFEDISIQEPTVCTSWRRRRSCAPSSLPGSTGSAPNPPLDVPQKGYAPDTAGGHGAGRMGQTS